MIITNDEIFNPIKGKKQDLIELFVGFYGEQWRDKITNRINNIEFIFVDNNPVTKITQFYDVELANCQRSFYEETGLNRTYENLLLIKEKLKSLDGVIKSIKEGTKVETKVDLGDIDKIAIAINIPIIEDLNSLAVDDNYIRIIEKVEDSIVIWENKYEPIYNELHQEKLQKIQPYIIQNLKYEDALDDNKNGIKEFVASYLKDKLPGFEFDKQPFIDLRDTLYYLLCVGKDKFGDEFYISNKYITLFKALGFDYGYDYDKYINDKQLVEEIFNEELLEKFNKLIVQKRISIMQENQMFQQAFAKVKQLDIKGGNYSIMSSIYNYMFCTQNRLGAFCSPYVAKDNTLKAVCVCPLGIELIDQTLIHEIGHFVQSDIIQNSENKVEIKCGFDMTSYQINEPDINFDIDQAAKECKAEDINSDKRPHEIFNEVVHDLLMTWLTQDAHNKGFKIGRAPDLRSAYSVGIKMLGQFVYNNQEKLKQLQIQPDQHKIEKMLGEENYNNLCKAIEKCFMAYMRNGKEIIQEINQVDSWNTASRLNLAKLDKNWSLSTRKYLDSFIEAQEVFNSLKNNQQFNV